MQQYACVSVKYDVVVYLIGFMAHYILVPYQVGDNNAINALIQPYNSY